MKYFLKPLLAITSALIIISCGVMNSSESVNSVQTVAKADIEPEIEPEIDDTVAVKTLTKEILTSLKNNEYESLAEYFHPDLGVRFSPYAFIEPGKDVQLKAGEFKEAIQSNKQFTWGNAHGSGNAIELTIPEYFKKYVYNADFLNAEKKSVNKMIGAGNSLNNLEKIYPDAIFTESYDPGKHAKAWTTLRLVFKKEAEKFYLIGIVHDQWTI